MGEHMPKMLEDFLLGPLATWLQTLETLMDTGLDITSSISQEKKSQDSPKEYFLKLVDGDFLLHVMELIDIIPWGKRPLWKESSDEAQRLQMLRILLQRLRNFYQDELQQLILTPLPNIHLLARDPLTAQGVREMRKLLLLLLGGAVQCERRDEIIGRIQTLEISTQAALASAIQEVTREPQTVLRMQWKELGPSEMEQLLRDLLPRIQELVHERDAGLERLWEPQKEQEVPPLAEGNCQHLGVQLAEARAQVRQQQRVLEEKMEELLDQEDELKDLQGRFHKIQQENRALASEARLAGLYRDELDVLREKALRTERLQTELTALRELLPAMEQCRVQLKEERDFSQALLETKALLEGQLEAARARGQRLSHLEKENLHLQSCLNQAQEERDQLYHQTEQLLRENVALERRLRQSLREPLDELRAEELESDWAADEPTELPVWLSCEVQDAGRLQALERENQELRRRLQEALENPSELRSLESEQKNASLHSKLESLQRQVGSEREEQVPDLCVHLPDVPKQREAERLTPERREIQTLEQEAKALVPGEEAGLSEAQTRLRELEQQWDAESLRASSLEGRLRSLQKVHADTLEKLEREQEKQHLEAERLVEEVQALERERVALQAGAQALQAAASQAEWELREARQTLQDERLQGARLAQKAQQAADNFHEARQELEALQRNLEQYKVSLAQLETEKRAAEEALRQGENQWRQLDKDNRRLKAQSQAQEEALSAQGLRLVHLGAQSRQQAAELSGLQETSQRLGELEQENTGLREQLEIKHEASTVLEEELQREKSKVKETEATLAQLRAQLLRKEENLQGTLQSRWCRHCQVQSEERQREGTSDEELSHTLQSQLEGLPVLNLQLVNGLPQAKGDFSVVPPALEEASSVTNAERQSEPELQPASLKDKAGHETLSARLIEVERKNATLQAEKLALMGRLGQLEVEVRSSQVALLDLRAQRSEAKEKCGQWQSQNSALQVEAASLRSQQALLDSQVSDLRQRLATLEAEARAAQQEREGWRGRYETLLRDHDRLTVLHERQGADLEGLLGKHASLKGALRSLEQEHRELQGRHSQLMGQKAGLVEREEALKGQKDRLEEAEQRHRELAERHGHLKEENEQVKQALAQVERSREDLQGELRGLQSRATGLQLEQARMEAESAALKEQNQQLDTALGRLSTQCELLAQLKGNQEEENRHLLQELQVLSRENRRLLENSMESREHFQEEQRQYLDKLGELRREKQKLVEKIMDQYRVLEPIFPRGKKSNWITEKLRKLVKPRREATREQLRPMAEGAGSSESLAGHEGHSSDGAVSSTPSSPAPLYKASSTLSILDVPQVPLRRYRVSSRMPAVDPAVFGNEEGQTTPRQRFRQRRLGMLGGSSEEAVVASAEREALSQISTSSQEERGPPLGEEEQALKSQL